MSYLVMDGRARFDMDRAVVCEVCDSLREAKARAPEYGDAVVVDGEIMEIVWTPEMAEEQKKIQDRARRRKQR